MDARAGRDVLHRLHEEGRGRHQRVEERRKRPPGEVVDAADHGRGRVARRQEGAVGRARGTGRQAAELALRRADVPDPVDPASARLGRAVRTGHEVAQHLHPRRREGGEAVLQGAHQGGRQGFLVLQPAPSDVARILCRGVRPADPGPHGRVHAVRSDQDVGPRRVAVREGGRDPVAVLLDPRQPAVLPVAGIAQMAAQGAVERVPGGHELRGGPAVRAAVARQRDPLGELDADRARPDPDPAQERVHLGLHHDARAARPHLARRTLVDGDLGPEPVAKLDRGGQSADRAADHGRAERGGRLSHPTGTDAGRRPPSRPRRPTSPRA